MILINDLTTLLETRTNKYLNPFFFDHLRSYVPAAAELEYLQIARRLEFYGIHPQDVTVSDVNIACANSTLVSKLTLNVNSLIVLWFSISHPICR